ncbi:MAG TPA: M6 family metalloprotease domain-containing protein [Smithellaceae bacterium]|nr:M6 family metalloprotease domain-containing protein [Smithellaceae bacterium]
MIKSSRLFILLFGLFLLIPAPVFAVSASPDPVEITQPSGGPPIKVFLKGMEWNNWVETKEGYTIAQDNAGYWRYVKGYDGTKPVLDAALVGQYAPPAHLSPKMLPSVYKKMSVNSAGHEVLTVSKVATEQESSLEENVSTEPAAAGDMLQQAPYGTFNGKILFILVRFSNRTGTYSVTSFANFLKNNIKDFFSKASNGKVTLSPAAESQGTANDGVVGWLNLGYNHPNTGDNTDTRNQQIVKDAILKANPYVNFASFDKNSDGYVDSDELAVVVIVAGFERSYSTYTPNVWGHKWSLDGVGAPTVDGKIVGAYHNGKGGYAQFGEIHQSNATDKHIASMGIMVHELGHLIFGLPDLYDTDYSTSGVGAFCVMSGGSWGKAATDTYSGQRPVLPSAWIRVNRGWVAPVTVGGPTAVLRNVIAAGYSTTGLNTVFKVTTPLASQYFLVENRRPVGYDRGLQKYLGASFGGLAIWHINSAAADNDGAIRKVDLEEADGTQLGTGSGSKTDLWYVGNKVKFDNTTNPNTRLYNGDSTCIEIISKSGPAVNLHSTSFKKPATCPCSPKDCGSYIGDCNPKISPCYCYKSATGVGFCADNWYCSCLSDCTTNADCPSGSWCAYDSCCGTPVCIPIKCTGVTGTCSPPDNVSGDKVNSGTTTTSCRESR